MIWKVLNTHSKPNYPLHCDECDKQIGWFNDDWTDGSFPVICMDCKSKKST